MKPRILLVDDMDDVRRAIARMLEPRYEVVEAADAGEALDALRTKGAFPVVISDERMPAVGGLELLRIVHAGWPDTIGILITGVADLPLAIRAVHEEHVFRFLEKPCSFEVLAAAIEAALESRRQKQAGELEFEKLFFSVESLEGFTAMLEDRIERQTATLRRMHRFALDLNTAESMGEIVRLAAEACSGVLGGRGAHVQVWDDIDGDVSVEGDAGPELSSRMHREPLRTKERQIGEIVVDLSADGADRLADADLSMLASIASSTAVAAHNEFRRRERDQAQHATILALARLSEQRDNETGKHIERVAAYSRLVAEALREDGKHFEIITDEWIQDIVRSSPLHDIGKVGIPDSILLKPGKLTPEEWEIMKTHAEIGAFTIGSVIEEFGNQSFLSMGRDIAWCHHEKWDGSGYPRGLSGPAIPLSARILALADVYDALTTVRPYKNAWTHAEAIAWIGPRGGNHFDPDVVTAFMRRAHIADEIRGRLADTIEDLQQKNPELAGRAK